MGEFLSKEACARIDVLQEAVHAVNRILAESRRAGIPIEIATLQRCHGNCLDGSFLTVVIPEERLRDTGHVRVHSADHLRYIALRDGLPDPGYPMNHRPRDAK